MTGTAFNQNTFNAYAYNDRNEVVGGQKYAGTDPNDKSNPVPSYDYDYNYDPIGNRETYDDAGTQTTYTANSLNQYSAISTLTDPVHDDDGNMTLMPSSSGDWTLEWNAENRLIRAEENSSPPGRGRVRVEYQYDYMGRRVRKQVFEWDDQANLWSPTADLRYIYDNWNLIAQFSLQPSSLIPDKTYTWGLDLSQSLQGAGGVGGLLSVSDLGPPTSDLWHPTYDANGNISEYLAPDGTIAAHYEYSPFGQITITSGTAPDTFTHRFSTKHLDPETELYYYGYRYYNPSLGRWLSRDPIGYGTAGFAHFIHKVPEHLGVFAADRQIDYHFLLNAPIVRTDFLGLATMWNANGCECFTLTRVDHPCVDPGKECRGKGSDSECFNEHSGPPRDFVMPWRECRCKVRKKITVCRRKHSWYLWGEKRICEDTRVTIYLPSDDIASDYVIKQDWDDCGPSCCEEN